MHAGLLQGTQRPRCPLNWIWFSFRRSRPEPENQVGYARNVCVRSSRAIIIDFDALGELADLELLGRYLRYLPTLPTSTYLRAGKVRVPTRGYIAELSLAGLLRYYQ